MAIKNIRGFIKLESSGGIILFFTAILALIISNSTLAPYYSEFFGGMISLHVGPFQIDKPFMLWINDGLMALFFLMVGLEIKWELFKGELKTMSALSLPLIAATGGMLVPATIYLFINSNGELNNYVGWAIPTATDIAFALGVLSLLGKRVPLALKIFLTSIAIFDDMGAILIIAVFYTHHISLVSLALSAFCYLGLSTLNRWRVTKIMPYGLIGLLLWIFVLKSGIHATLAGIIIAFAIPLEHPTKKMSPVRDLERRLHPWIAFLVLPLFAFANAGISFSGLTSHDLISPLALGIASGLFFGKQVGIFGATWIAVKLKLTNLPKGTNWLNVYGVSLLCGIGFTMSLFIGTLAFQSVGTKQEALVRFGVMVGSVLSGILGYLCLRYSLPKLSKEPS